MNTPLRQTTFVPSPAGGTITATLERLTEAGTLADQWRYLEQEADSSFFMSWTWVGPWLNMALTAGVELYLYRCREGEYTIALGLISRNRVHRRKVINLTQLALNEVRIPSLDMIIEYNDLLIRRGHEPGIRARLVADLLEAPIQWDELALGGIPETSWQEIAGNQQRLTPLTDELRTPWATDISQLKGDLNTLLAPMSSNRRSQLRRTFKAYEKEGELRLENAADTEAALRFFDEMGALHTARWNSVGESGSFANPNWVNFHRAVIREGYARDQIQVLKVSCGPRAIGYIYNFVWRGTVYMLQSGFAQEQDNTKRPGYVSHCLAMLYNSERGARVYDFMCGDAEYKRVFAQAQAPLVWGSVQQPRLKFKFERWYVAYRTPPKVEADAAKKPNPTVA